VKLRLRHACVVSSDRVCIHAWAGLEVPAEEQEAVRARLHAEHACLPVFLRDDVADMHYNGFSNR
jgi:trehalose-6-phosphate synthase